jgi:septal ring factor EnvC (AmiA/AmiB activator)
MYAGGAKLASGETSAPKPARPGDTPPRAFVGKTLDQLNKTLESYSTERDLLAKDIQKLTEEHSQVVRSLAAISAAISSLEAPEAQVDMQKLEDELSNVGTV